MDFANLYHWLFYTRNGMLILCLVCFIAFAIVAVVLELRTRKRFYHHAKKKSNKGEKIAKKTGEAAKKVADDLKERNVSENGLFGSRVDFDYDEDEDEDYDDADDDDGEYEEDFAGLFASLRAGLEGEDEEDE